MPYTSKIRATSKYLILFLVILNVACKKETTEPFFRMDESELLQNMSAEEGNRKVTISTNQKYTVISSQSWCKVSVFQDYFSISVYGNEDLQSRTASITITSKGFPERVVTVVQAGAPPVWGIPEESLIQHFTMDGDIRTIAVPTVREYTATSSQTWCAVTITDDGLEITVTPNDGEKRTSLVTLGAEGLSDILDRKSVV